MLSLWAGADSTQGTEFEGEIRPLIEAHCLACHGGEKTKGDVDFSGVHSLRDAESVADLWELVAEVVEHGEMPPEDEPPLAEDQRDRLLGWIREDLLGEIESLPATHKPRRLSGPEYRNTLRSLFGFDLEVNVAEAEQTVVEKSLVLKLLPTDPPGASGYVNDTHAARLSTAIWDQYSYLSDVAIDRFLADLDWKDRVGIETMIRAFVPRALRRDVSDDQMAPILDRIAKATDAELAEVTASELKAVVMSPGFLYRGMLMDVPSGEKRQKVDAFELAERLSYFLWEDMPDAELFAIARDGRLRESETLRGQVDRMLASPKSRTLAQSFGLQWLLLEQIRHDRNDPPVAHALKTQPIEFLHYLFSENRPVMEVIDSEVSFINAWLAGYYGADRKQLARFVKPKGFERTILPLQRISLKASVAERGAGILTMPGVLGMNEGPILRGTWMLRRLLGDHLGEPPPDVPPIKASPPGKEMSFRERFEAHRSDQSCALCHDKIDPLGFALEGYGETGELLKPGQILGKGASAKKIPDVIDTSGQLPSGERFADFAELHDLLLTSQRGKIVRNIVEQLLAYALCRKLERNDRPTVDALSGRILESDGTWRDLVLGIVESVPFQETLTANPHANP